MASHVPVVSTNAGGLGEVIIDGVTGYLSDVGDVPKMSQQAISILKDEKTLQTFRENAFQHAQQFNIDAIIPKYEAIYKRYCKDC